MNKEKLLFLTKEVVAYLEKCWNATFCISILVIEVLWEVISCWGTLKSMQKRLEQSFTIYFMALIFADHCCASGGGGLLWTLLYCCTVYCQRIWDLIVYFLQNTQCTELVFYKTGPILFKFILRTWLCMFCKIHSAQNQFSTKLGHFFCNIF